MGIGDDVIATGMAAGAFARGKRIAFGDGKTIRWGPYSKMIFKNNPNIAPPGSERAIDIEWISYYKGRRIYNSASRDRWIWNYDFKVKPGELFFDESEKWCGDIPDNLVLIEPNVPNKPCGPNKQWPVERFRALVKALTDLGLDVRQFGYGGPHRVCDELITKTYREAASLLDRCLFAVLPEGGLHHAAAAVDTPAVVLHGGFTPPAVLGYDCHVNLTGGATACGSFNECKHCREAMNAITVDTVVTACEGFICH